MNKFKRSLYNYQIERIKKGKIIEASNLPENEKVYLVKRSSGYKVVNLPFNEDGSFNWFNFLFGGKENLIKLILLIALVGLIYLGINELIMNYKLIADNPCRFCQEKISQAVTSLKESLT